MDNVSNIAKAPNQITSGSFTNEKTVSSLVPVSLQMTKSGLLVNLSGQSYTIKTIHPVTIQQLNQAQSFLLNIVQFNGAITQSTLLALGQGHSLPLPQALLSVLSRNTEQQKKLHQLANRNTGYPLPTAAVNDGLLSFSTGFRIKLEILQILNQGEYSALIKNKCNQLFLELSPIQFKAEVNLISALDLSKPILDEVTEETSETSNRKSIQKTDVNFQYGQLFKSLENVDIEGLPLNKVQRAQRHFKHDTSPRSVTSTNLLAGALEKAGGLPRSAPTMAQAKENLATRVLRLLPTLTPETLIELSQPQRLKQSLLAAISPATSPSDWLNTPRSNHLNTISLLFQLLLGRVSASKVSPELAQKLSMLQEHLALPEPLLQLLESSACLEPISKLLANLNLYHHASSKNDQATNYYFAIPYSINHYQEQIEAHVQKEKQPNSKQDDIWRLQLKFNLASGPLLISAQVIKFDPPQTSSSLKLGFVSANETVISKIELLKPSLTDKLNNIGFEQVAINTKKESVPASILPGEHYLVKIHV